MEAASKVSGFSGDGAPAPFCGGLEKLDAVWEKLESTMRLMPPR
jgi:hypothetical protein